MHNFLLDPDRVRLVMSKEARFMVIDVVFKTHCEGEARTGVRGESKPELIAPRCCGCGDAHDA